MYGDFDSGVRQVLLNPEIRYYFNPQNEKINWFALAGSEIEAFNSNDLTGIRTFLLKAGIGTNVFIGDKLSLESELFTIYQKKGSIPFFKSPSLNFETNFVYYRDAHQGGQNSAFTPSVGQGNWMIGGSGAGFNNTNFSSVKNFNSYLSPTIGYFLSDRLLVATDISLNYSTLKTDFTIAESNFTSRSLGIAVNPFMRYYPGRLDRQIRPFFEVSGSWSYFDTKFDTSSVNPSVITRNTSAFIGGGVNIFLSRNVALEIGLNLGKDLQNGQTQVGLQIGLKFFLSGKRK